MWLGSGAARQHAGEAAADHMSSRSGMGCSGLRRVPGGPGWRRPRILSIHGVSAHRRGAATRTRGNDLPATNGRTRIPSDANEKALAAGQGKLAEVRASRGGLAAPEAPFVIEHREALIYISVSTEATTTAGGTVGPAGPRSVPRCALHHHRRHTPGGVAVAGSDRLRTRQLVRRRPCATNAAGGWDVEDLADGCGAALVDGGRPSVVALQGEAANHRQLLR
jgi:hypothetical protein